MKFCIDCIHFSPEEGDETHRYARCAYNHHPSLVTGQKDRSSMDFCSVERSSARTRACGEDGKYFQEKEYANDQS